jgi:hypothetical protein
VKTSLLTDFSGTTEAQLAINEIGSKYQIEQTIYFDAYNDNKMVLLS